MNRGLTLTGFVFVFLVYVPRTECGLGAHDVTKHSNSTTTFKNSSASVNNATNGVFVKVVSKLLDKSLNSSADVQDRNAKPARNGDEGGAVKPAVGSWYVKKYRSPDKKIRHHEKVESQRKKFLGIDWSDRGSKNITKTAKKAKRQKHSGISRNETESGTKHHRKNKHRFPETKLSGNETTLLANHKQKKTRHGGKKKKDLKVPPAIDNENEEKEEDEGDELSKKCIGCDPKDKKKRIDSLRRQLLEKFRFESPQGAFEPPPPLPPQYHPENMQDDHADDLENNFYAKTKEIIIPADDVSRHCANRHATGCFYVNLEGKVAKQVTSAKLWVFKNRDWNDKQQSFTISELEQDTSYNYTKLRPKNIVQRIETDVKTGWMHFNITNTVLKWLDKPHMNHGFSIRCKTCYTRNHRVVYGGKEGYKPLLIIYFGNEGRRRSRRSIDCTPGETLCCRQRFYIEFKEIGDITVLTPRGIWANYCTGSCYDGTMSHHNHTRMIQAMRWRSARVNASLSEELTPCCAPISYTTKSMLITVKGELVYSEVPNISVQACGCI